MMRLREYVQVNFDLEKIVVFYRDGIQIENSKRNMSFINALLDGISESDYNDFYPDCNHVLQLLQKHNFITYYDSDRVTGKPEERLLCYLDQFSTNPKILYSKLNDANICIIGVGGIGGNILQMLMSSGIKNYVLIDFDTVEFHNLNRQYMYSILDVGKKKADICKEKLLQFDSSINCEVYCKKISSVDDLLCVLGDKPIDIIISAADTPLNIGCTIRDVAREKKCAFLAGSLGIDYGSYVLLSPTQLDNYVPSKPLIGMELIRRDVIKGSFGPTNAIISSYMAMDIVYYLIGEKTWSNGKTVLFDFLKKKVSVVDL